MREMKEEYNKRMEEIIQRRGMTKAKKGKNVI